MDTNVCGMNHVDRDVLLPPRKRLLAGLKKQNSDPPSHQISPPSTSNEVDTQLNSKLNHHLSSNTSSPEEIAESSRLAAIAAMNAAKAARAVAEEKAIIAAEAVAAAKSALELSASVSEETVSTEESKDKDKHSKKNKLKKHIPVQILYNKHRQFGTTHTDEELARKLHRDMNSSLRISKNSSSFNLKNHKHKRMKLLPPFEKGRIANGGMAFDENVQSNCSINAEPGEVNFERCILDIDTVKVDGKRAQFCNGIQLKRGNGEVGSSQSSERIHEIAEDTSPSGRKRGRVKLKKLSLSICAIRDQSSPSKGNKSSTVTEDDETGKSTAGTISLFPMDISIDKGGCRGFINMDMSGLQGTPRRSTK